MTIIHPLDILQGYRLGSRQATVELQRTDVSGIHIEFDVFKLVDVVRQQPGQAIILTGTAGDGKTYLAYRIMDALGLDETTVRKAQVTGGYDQDGVYIDLDLSAGTLDHERQKRLYQALSQPGHLTLICANEGKLDELSGKLIEQRLEIPKNVLAINLSRRALVSPQGWRKVLAGVLENPMWQNLSGEDSSIVARNRDWLSDPDIAERLRRYLLLPYLLGEPITIRETLSFLAYALGSGLSAEAFAAINNGDSKQVLPYLLFNALFGEPDGHTHGGRAAPAEKLLWWLFRFDPAIQASPKVDQLLLISLDRPDELGVIPPTELLEIWKKDLVVLPQETSDTGYRQRLARFMGYARRWYALASEQGFDAYFPFRHFRSYLAALTAPSDQLEKIIPDLIQGLNLLLSGGHETEKYGLKIFYLPAEEVGNTGAIYSAQEVDLDDFILINDVADEERQSGDIYLERLPRRLYLQYQEQPKIRLPISLLLYEVLLSAASDDASFPATLWVKERDTVARFMSRLSRTQDSSAKVGFRVFIEENLTMDLIYRPKRKSLSVS